MKTNSQLITLPAGSFILGRKRSINLPNGEKHNAQFAIVELDNILASHNEETFANTPGYPRNQFGDNLNDRNYGTDKSAQQLVMEYARHLNPDLLIAMTSTPEGTPIITPGGIVVSGNNRTMSLKLAQKKKAYFLKWKDYVVALEDQADIFGISLAPDTIGLGLTSEDGKVAIKHPVLVRIDYDFGELTTTNMAKYNASAMKAKSPVDRAAELATTLREQVLCETNIPVILGEFDTLGEFYGDRSAVKRMVAALLHCSVLNEQDLPAYLDGGYFTEDGKTLLETVLASIVLEPDTLRVANRDGVRSLRQVVVNSLPVLIQNKNLPAAASLISFVNQAIMYQGELVASGLPWPDFVNQPKLFADMEVGYDYRSIYLNRLLLNGPRRFRQAVAQYNTSQAAASEGAALFADEVVTPQEAFKGYIVKSIPEGEAKLVERYFGPKFKLAEKFAEAARNRLEPKFAPGDRVRNIARNQIEEGVVNRRVTSGHPSVAQHYSVNSKGKAVQYWDESDMELLGHGPDYPSLQAEMQSVIQQLELELS